MKKTIPLYSFLILLLGIGSSNAQSPKSEFNKTIDSINAIIKKNPLAYYISNKQYSSYITKISATEQGTIKFIDSIPEPEIIVNTDKTVVKKMELIPDCCPQKNSRRLDLFSIKEMTIYFPYIYLKDENKEIFAKFLGFKKPDLEKLREQLEKLKTLCKKEKIKYKI
ncbi:MAG TPA: hypothetical protein VIV55_03800 [Flavobacterium sp.]